MFCIFCWINYFQDKTNTKFIKKCVHDFIKIKMTIKDFIKQNSENFDRYRKQKYWKDYTVYHVLAKRNEGACVELPKFALKKESKIRLANLEEIHAIMKQLH